MMKLTMKLINNKRSIIILLLTFLMMSCLLGTTSDLIAFAADVNAFDRTFVMDDLNSSTVNGVPFDAADYPKDAKGTCSIVSFTEYCYGYRVNARGNFGLYLYIYNPQALDIATGIGLNKVQMAVGYDDKGVANGYEDFDLQFCSNSSDNLFYKFKVLDHKSAIDDKKIVERVKTDERRYDISGFTLIAYGDRNATGYTVGGTYTFTGFAKGFGLDTMANTLHCNVMDFETLELKIHPTVFRTNTSSLGLYHQNQLNSVYFNIPTSIAQKYGSICNITADWYEYKTEPIFVTRANTSPNDIYGLLKNRPGKILENIPGSQYYNYYFQVKIASKVDGATGDRIQYNNNIVIENCNDYHMRNLPYVFDRSDLYLSAKDLTDYIYSYDKSFVKGTLDIKSVPVSRDLFSNTVDSGRTIGHNTKKVGDTKINLLSFADTSSAFGLFITFGLRPPTENDSYYNKAPIVELKPEDLFGDISKNLLVDSHDVKAFSDYCTNSFLTGNVPYLFRFASTDYVSLPASVHYEDGSYGGADSDYSDSYFATETLFLNFKIIEVTFNKDGVYRVMPVVCDPIDVVGPVSEPVVPLSLLDILKQIWDEMVEFFKKIGKWIVFAIGVIILVIIACSIIKVIVPGRRSGVNIHMTSDGDSKSKSSHSSSIQKHSTKGRGRKRRTHRKRR